MEIIGILLYVGAVWTTDGTDGLLRHLDKLEFGNVSVASSGRITLAPALVELAALTEAAAWQLARDNAGNVYVATGSQARLFRLNRGSGKPEQIYDGGTGEILALTTGADGTVYFATTPAGRVFRLKPGARAESLCTTGESYVFSLLPGPGRTILCATGEHGRIYSISPQGRAEILFTARQAHLTALAWLVPDRELLVGTSPDGVVYRLKLAAKATRPEVSVLYDTPLDEVRALAVDRAGRVYIGANPASAGDSTGAQVYCVGRDGIVRWSWSCPDSTVFDLAPQDQGALMVATGNRGTVYELDSLGRMSVLHKVTASQVLAILESDRATLIGTGNAARLYQSVRGYADSGYIIARPYDCTNPAGFGRLDYRADVPAGTALKFDARTGNSETPDSTWSSWASIAAEVRSPDARFIQWRARLSTGFPNLTPELRRVDVYYRPVNRAPIIKKLDVADLPLDAARKGAGRPDRPISWEATDPDSDSLAFEIYFRGEGEASWSRVPDDITDAKYELDTRALPDGWYEVRLTASDQPGQPRGDALLTEQISRPFPVDNTAPLIADLRIAPAGALFRVTFTARDALSAIVAARVSVNAGEWQNARPVDGILDSTEERFTIDLELSPGDNTVAVVALDAQGNTGPARTRARR